jgi:hypothetical protein
MQIEDRLDALLTTRFSGMTQDTGTAFDDELMPLLQAADALDTVLNVKP